MYVVTNRIDLKKGYAEKMAPHFTKGGKIEDLQGFIKIEVWQIENEADYDQMYVNTLIKPCKSSILPPLVKCGAIFSA